MLLISFVILLCVQVSSEIEVQIPDSTDNEPASVIRKFCHNLVISFPNINSTNQTEYHQLREYCQARFSELSITNVNETTSSPRSIIKNQSSNLVILDLDRTLSTSIQTDYYQQQQMLHPIRERNTVEKAYLLTPWSVTIVRDGVMELINASYHGSVDLVLYSQGGISRVIINAIFMEIVFNHYWIENEYDELSKQFQFDCVISERKSLNKFKSFERLGYYNYDLMLYKHIIVVDDLDKVWYKNDITENLLREHYGVLILKLSAKQFPFLICRSESEKNVTQILNNYEKERDSDDYLFAVIGWVDSMNDNSWQEINDTSLWFVF
eukprot:526529_1